jgi:hypothetical protein
MRQKKLKPTSMLRSPLAGGLFGAACLIAPVLAPAPALAQVGEDAPVLFFDVGIGLEYEDQRNRDATLEATTRFGVGYFTSTARQRLSFETGVTARASNEDGHNLINPFARIDYARFNRDIELGFDLAYAREEIESDDLEEDFDAGDLARQDGTRDQIDFGVRLVTGRAAPFGTDTELRYSQDTFADGATDDDSTTHSARSTLRFTIDPRIELSLTGFWEQVDTDDAVNTLETTQRVTLGGVFAIDRAWTASASLGFAELETETTAATTVEDGLEGSFLLTRDLRNGSLSFSTDHVITDDGWRNTLRARRLIEMANGDLFDASVGQIFFEEGGSGHLASLDFTRTVRSGALSLGFDYSSDLDDADLLVQRTQLSASLRQDITDFSGWSIDGTLASVDYDNPATIDAARLEVGLAYLHALSNDWTLAARARHQVLYEDGDLADRTNILSLNLERRFSVRP